MRLVPHRHHPVRVFFGRVGRSLRQPFGGLRPPRSRRGILFISGEPGTPGHAYRVTRHARAAAEAGFTVTVTTADRPDPALREAPALVVIWRAVWSESLARTVAALRAAGARVVFDIDDYMFDPAAARIDLIDGIRSQQLTEAAVAGMYALVNRTLRECDECIATTEPLASGLRRWGKPASVAPNGFDEETYLTARKAALARRGVTQDGIVRIGYAGGSRTHQRDFAVAAPALARILREHPATRLVLFCGGPDGPPLVDIREFPELSSLRARVEWRQLVPLAALPTELARFDVNIAPLETGNVFCEAKSELKYFEAALAGAVTVASPTAPFAGAIRNGITGLLAADTAQWHAALEALVGDAALRRRLADSALFDVLWKFGPDGRRERVRNLYSRLVAEPCERTHGFLAQMPGPSVHRPLPHVVAHEEISAHGGRDVGDVAVVIPVYNYGRYVEDALTSVARSSLERLELVVVDDGSTDDSVAIVQRWMRRNAGRFVTALHLRNRVNSGLALARNVGFARAEAPFVFPLDADNTLTRHCLRMLRDRLVASGAAAAHPSLARFGGETRLLPARPWTPERFSIGNYIDAMALIRRSAWAHVGGYAPIRHGWEDYDFWCLFVEAGLWSEAVPRAVARYRVHGGSMLHSSTDVPRNRREVASTLRLRHAWLDIPGS